MGGFCWSPEDDQRLRDFHKSDLSTEEIALQFEGRTPAGVQGRFRKLKLGVRPIARARWTDDENAVLRRIWFEKGTLKALVAKNLPRRSWRAAHDQGLLVLGLSPRGPKARCHSFSWATIELDRVLEAEPNLAISEIIARCRVSRERVTHLLKDGKDAKYYRSGWRNGRKTPLWSLGCGPEAPVPPIRTRTESSRRTRLKKRIHAGRIDPFATLVQQIAA